MLLSVRISQPVTEQQCYGVTLGSRNFCHKTFVQRQLRGSKGAHNTARKIKKCVKARCFCTILLIKGASLSFNFGATGRTMCAVAPHSRTTQVAAPKWCHSIHLVGGKVWMINTFMNSRILI